MEEGAPAAPSGGRGLWIAIAVIIIVIVVVVAAIFAAPLLFPPPAEGPETVIGTVFPITGDLDAFGRDMALSASLARDHINAQGGVLEGTLRLVQEDSQTDDAEGVIAARKLVDVDGAVAMVGAAASAVSRPIAENVAVPSRVVQISPSSTSPFFTTFNEAITTPTDRFFFRTAPSDSAQGKVAAGYLFDTLGWRDVAILARDDTYGQGLASVFQSTFEGFTGTSVTIRQDYDPGLPSYSTEIDLMFATNPDGIYWVPFPTEGDIIMDEWWADPARRSMGWFGADGIRDEDFWQGVRDRGIDTSNQKGTAPTASLDVADNAAQFSTDFQAAFGFRPTTFASNVYDAVFLIAAAIEAGGSADKQDIRDNLLSVSGGTGTVVNYGEWEEALTELAAGRAINYEGASGSVNIDEFGDVGSDYEVWIFNEATGEHETEARIAEADIPASPPLLVSFETNLFLPLVGARD